MTHATQREISRALAFVLELRDCGATTDEAIEQAAVAYDVDEVSLRDRFELQASTFGV